MPLDHAASMASIVRAIDALHAVETEGEAGRLAAAHASAAFGGIPAAVYLRESPQRGVCIGDAGGGTFAAAVEMSEPLSRWPYRPGEIDLIPQILDELAAAPQLRPFYERGARGLVCAAFGREARAVGCIVLANPRPLDAQPSSHELNLLSAIAIACGATLDRIQAATPLGLIGAALDEIVFRTDARGTIDFVNAAWFAYTGLTPAEAFLDLRWTSVFHPDDVGGVTSAWRSAVADGRAFGVEARMQGTDGLYRWFLIRAAPARTPSGVLTRWFGTMTSVDAERSARAAIEVVAEAFPGLTAIADAQGRMRWFNTAWHRFAGSTSSMSARGDEWIACVHPAERAAFAGAWTDAVRRGEPFARDVRLCGADGVLRNYAFLARPLIDACGNPRRWFVIASDADGRLLDDEPLTQLPVLPRVPRLVLDGCYVPARNAEMRGGDWYDAQVLGDGHVLLAVGDVPGGGPIARAVAPILRAAIRAAAWMNPDPGQILGAASTVLAQTPGATYATVWVGILDPGPLTIRYASAGHPAPFLRHGTAVRALTGGIGVPLGLGTEPYPTAIERLGPGAGLILYTNGLLGAVRDDGVVQDAIRAAGLLDVRASLLRDSVVTAPPNDDVVILTAQVSLAGVPGEARKRD